MDDENIINLSAAYTDDISVVLVLFVVWVPKSLYLYVENKVNKVVVVAAVVVVKE